MSPLSARSGPSAECQLTLHIPPPPRGIDAWASLAGGAWLVAAGLTGRATLRLPIVAIGGWLLARGMSGVYDPAITRGAPQAKPQSQPPIDPLDEGLEESFPASDSLAVSPAQY